MKRLFIWALMATMLVAVPEMAQAQKTVTYTFKGSILSGLSDSGTLYLKSSGKKPAGVPDPTKADIHNYEKHLLGGLSTLYTIQENEYAWIDFTNFKYEIEEVKWRRRSQWNLVTSKGGSWITTFDGQDVGYTAYEPENGAEDAEAGDMPFSTSGEILYHYRTFATRAEVSPGVWENFAGLKKLNVQVTSTQVYKGIAVKEFDIKYYEPEPKIEVVEEIRDGSDNLTGYKIKITIGKEQHVGAFTADDFLLDYDDTKLDVTPFGAPHMEGSTIRADYRLDIKTGATGSTVVSAIITNGADNIIAGRSQKPLSLQISAITGFHWTDQNQWNGTAGTFGNRAPDMTWGNSPNGNNMVIDKPNQADPQATTFSLGNLTSDRQLNYRQTIIEMGYTIDVPAWTKITRNLGFTCTASYGNGTGETSVSEINNFEDNHVNGTFNFTSTNSNSVCFKSTQTTSTGSGDLTWTFNNFTEDCDETKTATKYVSLRGALRQPSLTAYPSGTWTFAYQNTTTKSSGGFEHAFVYDYYAYPKFYIEESSAVANAAPDATQTAIHKSAWTDNAVKEKGGIPGETPSTTEGDPLTKIETLGLTKTGFTFVGWKDIDDNDRIYADGEEFCPYDAANGCGKGPHRLVALWVENSATDMIVTFYAEGGEIPASTIANAEYMHQVQVNAGHSDWATKLPDNFKPAKVGCTFDGYFDQEGVKVFNADLTSIKVDSKYFNSDGTWKATDDVDFYAHFTPNPSSVSEKWTINFDKRGGTTSLSSVTVVKGGKVNNNVGTNPDTHESWIPTKDGYVFTGWYTATSGGTMVYDESGVAIKLKTVHEENLSAAPPTPAWAEYEAYDNTRWTDDGKWNVAGTGTLQLYAQWKESSLTFDEKDSSIDPLRTGHPTTYSDEEEMPKVILKRTFVADKWNTICFPFALNQTQASYLFSDIEEFTGVTLDGSSADMTFTKRDAIEAGKPYFVKINAGSVTDSRPAYFTKVAGTITGLVAKEAVLETDPGTISIDGPDDITVKMIGSFEVYRHITEGDMYLQNDMFYTSGETYNDKKVWGNNLGYRCTFNVSQGSAGSARIRLMIDLEGYDGWTGWTEIEDVDVEEALNGDIFDLSGRKLQGIPAQGIYIRNGKKYFVK